MNIVDDYMDWLLFVTMMEIGRLLTVLQTMREIADSVTDIVGDCCLCYWL